MIPTAHVWEFRVRPEAAAEFERHYGAAGSWVRLFRRSSDFIETLLLKDSAVPGRYLTVDRWNSEATYAEFRARHADEYAKLDAECAHLTIEERSLGGFDEMRAPALLAKDAAAVLFPPPLVPLAVVLAGIGLERLWPLAMPLTLDAPARYWLGGVIVVGAIFGLVIRSAHLMRRSGQNELPWTPTTSIIDHGPYRFTRNPMYLAMVIGCVGFAVALASLWILLLTPVCAWLLQRIAIVPEERYLEAKFGAVYLDYKRRVRRWL